MSLIRRVSKLSVLVVLTALATGCIVLPFGRGHGRYGHGDRYYSPTSEGYSSGANTQREQPRRGGR